MKIKHSNLKISQQKKKFNKYNKKIMKIIKNFHHKCSNIKISKLKKMLMLI